MCKHPQRKKILKRDNGSKLYTQKNTLLTLFSLFVFGCKPWLSIVSKLSYQSLLWENQWHLQNPFILHSEPWLWIIIIKKLGSSCNILFLLWCFFVMLVGEVEQRRHRSRKTSGGGRVRLKLKDQTGESGTTLAGVHETWGAWTWQQWLMILPLVRGPIKQDTTAGGAREPQFLTQSGPDGCWNLLVVCKGAWRPPNPNAAWTDGTVISPSWAGKWLSQGVQEAVTSRKRDVMLGCTAELTPRSWFPARAGAGSCSQSLAESLGDLEGGLWTSVGAKILEGIPLSCVRELERIPLMKVKRKTNEHLTKRPNAVSKGSWTSQAYSIQTDYQDYCDSIN